MYTSRGHRPCEPFDLYVLRAGPSLSLLSNRRKNRGSRVTRDVSSAAKWNRHFPTWGRWVHVTPSNRSRAFTAAWRASFWFWPTPLVSSSSKRHKTFIRRLITAISSRRLIAAIPHVSLRVHGVITRGQWLLGACVRRWNRAGRGARKTDKIRQNRDIIIWLRVSTKAHGLSPLQSVHASYPNCVAAGNYTRVTSLVNRYQTRQNVSAISRWKFIMAAAEIINNDICLAGGTFHERCPDYVRRVDTHAHTQLIHTHAHSRLIWPMFSTKQDWCTKHHYMC